MKKLHVVKESKVHGKGVFAKYDIEPCVVVLEYVGIKVTKAKSTKITEAQMAKALKDPSKGQVYMFEISSRYDIDGNISSNDAKLINHSCDPNCETDVKKGKILISSIRPIARGEELSYNYGFSWDPKNFTDHVCKCGSKNCVGYIIAQDQWRKLATKLKRLNKVRQYNRVVKSIEAAKK